jgi:parallel beta-helix repeat protein
MRRAPIAVALALLALPAPAAARTLDVHPGSLHRALERADRGDTLIVHEGRYKGSFVIRERLKVFGAQGERRPLIDGLCRTRVTVEVAADGVVLRRLHVVGADESAGTLPIEVDFTDRRSGTISHSLLRDTCDAEYGVNVFHSRRIRVIRNRALGFSDAGIYVGGVDTTGSGVLTVRGNRSFNNNRGFILEDSAGGTIRVLHNRFTGNRSPGHGPPSGIFVRNSDAGVFRENTVTGNGRFGVDLDGNSDRNRFVLNLLRPNPVNVRDLGSGNCGGGNRPDAFPAC